MTKKQSKYQPSETASAPATLDLSPLTTLLSFHMRMLMLEVNRAYDDAFSDTPLAGGTGKLTSLMLIGANPGISQSEIGRVLSKDRPAMVRIIAHLEADGMVRRERRGGEQRRYHLVLTTAGHARVAEFIDRARSYDARFFAPLTDTEQQALRRLLHKLRAVYQPETIGMEREP